MSKVIQYYGRVDDKGWLVEASSRQFTIPEGSGLLPKPIPEGFVEITKDIYNGSKEDSYRLKWSNGEWIKEELSKPSISENYEFELSIRNSMLNQQREEEKNSGFVYKENSYNSDSVSLQNINSAVTRALIAKYEVDIEYTEQWITKDNIVVTLNIDEIIELGKTVNTFISNIYKKYRALKDMPLQGEI